MGSGESGVSVLLGGSSVRGAAGRAGDETNAAFPRDTSPDGPDTHAVLAGT